jgi:N-acetylmuramoyl-L-alanine amidase
MSRAKASTSKQSKTPGGDRLTRAVVIARRLLIFLLFCIAFGAVSIRIILMHRPSPINQWSGLVGYEMIPSPNYNDRPDGTVVSCIVVHSTAQHSLEGTIKVFQDPLSKVSAHFVVGKDGTVVQMVPLTQRAWHAGVSEFDGVPGVNDYSIGIEISNLNNGKDPYTEAQYRAIAEIVRRCRLHYKIPNNRIVSHALIALPPGRKDDPLGFDFQKLYHEASAS